MCLWFVFTPVGVTREGEVVAGVEVPHLICLLLKPLEEEEEMERKERRVRREMPLLVERLMEAFLLRPLRSNAARIMMVSSETEWLSGLCVAKQITSVKKDNDQLIYSLVALQWSHITL